jgi:hypothetical protein
VSADVEGGEVDVDRTVSPCCCAPVACFAASSSSPVGFLLMLRLAVVSTATISTADGSISSKLPASCDMAYDDELLEDDDEVGSSGFVVVVMRVRSET